jgi:hypothetical protein
MRAAAPRAGGVKRVKFSRLPLQRLPAGRVWPISAGVNKPERAAVTCCTAEFGSGLPRGLRQQWVKNGCADSMSDTSEVPQLI